MSYNTTNRGYLSQVDTPSLVFAAFALSKTQSGADPLVRGRRPRPPAAGVCRCLRQRVQGDPRGPGGPPHSLVEGFIPLDGLQALRTHWISMLKFVRGQPASAAQEPSFDL